VPRGGGDEGYHPAIVRASGRSDPPQVPWTFITTHGLVLLAIARDPTIRLREVAERVRVTERAVQRIVADLVDAGYLSKTRVGRRNVYRIHGELHLPHATTRHQQVGALMATLMAGSAPKKR
jgi:predicted DNA-binding transcriptional regulator YafY